MSGLPDSGFYDLDLKQFFERHGFNVRSATVAGDPKNMGRKSLGYGYISFNEEAELERCLTTLNNVELGGKTISLSRQADRSKFNP